MYKLCGGTLLVLLMHSSIKNTTETVLLSDISKILKPKIYIDNGTIKEQTKKFKLCKEHSTFATPFEDSSMKIQLSDEIENNYSELLKRTDELIKHYIDTDPQTSKDELLVKALLEVIEKDDSIPEHQEFYILPNGKTVKKHKLLSITKFYLPSFLLGILFYVFINIKDNKEGATTYDEWCPKPKSGTKREYTANIGENSTKHIILIHTPDEYDDYELLDLSGELIMLYVKKIPTNDEYDISNSAITTSENPDSSEKNDYDEFHLCLNDYQEISAFIADFNKLLNCIKAHQNSINKDDINIIGKNKETFYRHWITYSPKFKDSSIQKWFDLILSKIAKSAIIDINNITLVTTPKYLLELSRMELSRNVQSENTQNLG